jgi:hypothetical protein
MFVAGAVLLLTTAALAQRGRRGGGFAFGSFGGPVVSTSDVDFPEEGEFHYLRLEYNDYTGNRGFNGSRRGQANGWWAQDFPDTENHFSFGLMRLTNLSVGRPAHLPLVTEKGQPEIFDYPWIYVTQNGYWVASEDEIEKLREFFARGGFMMTDDTWGPQEQASFADIMARVFPDREIIDISEQDPIMHVMYDILDKDRTYIPGARHLGYNGQIQNVGAQPRWMAIHDNKDRVIVAVNYDTDIGDAWEYADAPFYPEHMTTLAYHYGINYLIYSMTH